MNLFSRSFLFGLVLLGAPFVTQAEDDRSWRAIITADYYWGSAKVANIREGDDSLPVLAVAVEHSWGYVPHIKLRNTHLSTSKLKHNKTDFTFYWHLLKTENLKFDAGFTLTDYSNSFYQYLHEEGSFDDVIFSWYAMMNVAIPNSNFGLMAQFDYGEVDSIKTADVVVGLEYQPLNLSELKLRVGYRVLDYTFKQFDSKAYGQVDGWFAGASYTF